MTEADADRRYRILVIEDNPDAAESLRLLLELSGHEVRVAEDGRSGLEACRAAPPDLVLCDVGLPGGMDGYDVARAIRSDDALGSTLLVAVTGFGQAEDARRSREAGFDIHLTKPVDMEGLQDLIGRLKLRG